MNKEDYEKLLAKLANVDFEKNLFTKDVEEFNNIEGIKVEWKYEGPAMVVGFRKEQPVNSDLPFSANTQLGMFVDFKKYKDGKAIWEGHYWWSLFDTDDIITYNEIIEGFRGTDPADTLPLKDDWVETDYAESVLIRYPQNYWIPKPGSVTAENPIGEQQFSQRTGQLIGNNYDVIIRSKHGPNLQTLIRRQISRRTPYFVNATGNPIEQDKGPKNQQKQQNTNQAAS